MFYASLIGETINLEDIREFEPDMFHSLNKVLQYSEKELQDYLEGEFVIDGVVYPITTENRDELISRKVNSNFDPTTNPMRTIGKAFRALIKVPSVKGMAKHIREKIQGQLTVDISDLKRHAVIEPPYTKFSHQVEWLWEILESFDDETRLQFLKFTTGLSSLPIGGASKFRTPFTIERSRHGIHHFPTAHTCSFRLAIPEYPTKEWFKEKLTRAIIENSSVGLS
jgi:E3 ubiquitin-protein ligase NEDD4